MFHTNVNKNKLHSETTRICRRQIPDFPECFDTHTVKLVARDRLVWPRRDWSHRFSVYNILLIIHVYKLRDSVCRVLLHYNFIDNGVKFVIYIFWLLIAFNLSSQKKVESKLATNNYYLFCITSAVTVFEEYSNGIAKNSLIANFNDVNDLVEYL